MNRIRSDHPLRRHFAGLVEQAFCTQVGLCDPSLTDYMVRLLVDFMRTDRLQAISNAHGKRLEQIAAMLTVVSQEQQPKSRIERDRTVYRNIGDYTLFWAGLFPEHLRQSSRGSSDVILTYVSQGKKSYAIVSELSGENDTLPASLFRHLSEDFEYCLYGLGLVRREWQRVGGGPDEIVQ